MLFYIKNNISSNPVSSLHAPNFNIDKKYFWKVTKIIFKLGV